MELVLIGSHVDGGVDGRELVLCGRHFVMLGLCQHAEFPQLLVEVLHEGGDAGFDGAEVVVFEFLSFWRSRTEKRSSRVHQVAALLECLAVDEEIFLFGTDGGDELLRLSAEEVQEFHTLAGDRFHGAEQRGLFVESLSVVAAEGGGDAQRPVLDERVGSGIPRGVASRLEGRAEAAARERAGVGFAFDQLLAVEFHDDAAVGGGRDEGIVLLGGQTRHGLEPMRKVRHPFLHSPILHRARDDVGGVEGEGTIVLAAISEFLISAFGQSFAHHPVVEDHAAEQFRHYHNVLLLRSPRERAYGNLVYYIKNIAF